jgi:hypothetical protein
MLILQQSVLFTNGLDDYDNHVKQFHTKVVIVLKANKRDNIEISSGDNSPTMTTGNILSKKETLHYMNINIKCWLLQPCFYLAHDNSIFRSNSFAL